MSAAPHLSAPQTTPAEIPGPMGDRAAAGFAMMAMQSLATRVVNFAGQIALAALLLPEAFGLMALANTVVLVAGLVQQIGVREALLARPAEFERQAGPAFWMSAAAGLVAGAAMALSALPVAKLYGNPHLVGLVLVLALSVPIGSLGLVAEADAQRTMKFRFLALVAGGTGIATTAVMVLLAMLGFGAYSFVLPRVIVGAVRLVVLWSASGLRPGWSWQIGRWHALAGASAMMFLSSVLMVGTQVGDVAILGKLVPAEQVGYYAFALGLSLQTIITISQSVATVMLPTLGKLVHDRERLRGAFIRTTRVLAAKVAPICALQFAAAAPAMHAVFGHKWDAAIEPVRALSFGMLCIGVFIPVASLLQAQGKFRLHLWLAVLNVGVFLALVPLGAWMDGVRGTAIAMSAFMVTCGLAWGVCGGRTLEIGAGEVVGLVLRPSILAAAGAGAGWGLSLVLPPLDGRLDDLGRAATIGVVCMAVYVPLVRVFMPEAWADILDKFGLVLARLGVRARA